MFRLGHNSSKYLKSISDKDLIILASQAILRTSHDFGIHHTGGFRTAERQNKIYKAGYSTCDGYVKKSNHQSGKALDLVPWVGDKFVWDPEIAIEISKVMKTLAIENGIFLVCGADWEDYPDPYHYQTVRV